MTTTDDQTPKGTTEADSLVCVSCAAADGSPAWVKPGVNVWTRTTSGAHILCTVLSKENSPPEGEWLLDSPAHGYCIVRHHSELEPENAKDQAQPDNQKQPSKPSTMAEENDTQKPSREAVDPASAGSVAFGDMWIAPSGALAFCWTVTRHQRTQELTAEAVTFADGKWGGLTSCSATWAQRKRIRRTIPDPQGLKLAICQAACGEIDRPIEYAAWKRGTPKGWSSGIPQNAERRGPAAEDKR